MMSEFVGEELPHGAKRRHPPTAGCGRDLPESVGAPESGGSDPENQ